MRRALGETESCYDHEEVGMEEFESRGRFPGITSPNTTQVPDQYLDELLPVLTGGELKVLLYITRRTFGFKKAADTISLSQMLFGIRTRDGRQLDRGCGLSKKTLLDAIRSLREQNIILTERRRSVERGDEPTSYRLNILGAGLAEARSEGVGKKLPQGGGAKTTPGPWRRNSPTQQTGEQHTARQQTVSSTFITSNAEQAKNQIVDNVPGSGTARPLPVQSTPRRFGELASQEAIDQLLIITVLTEEFSRDFNDEAHEKANTTQAMQLYRRSGLPENQFTQRMYEARSITRDQRHQRGVMGGGPPVAKAMPYFFAVLKDLLTPKESETPVADKSPESGSAVQRHDGASQGRPE